MKYLLSIALTFAGCVSKPVENKQERVTDSVIFSAPERIFERQLSQKLKDTVVNNIRFSFDELPKRVYDSLWTRELSTEIQLEEPGSYVQNIGNCLVVDFRNGKRDSLCNKDEGDNQIRHSIKGAWSAKSLLLASYSDWEGGNDYFLSLSDGSGYNLAATYLLSPDERMMVTYEDPGLVLAQFLIVKIRPGTVETLFHLEFADIMVTDAAWISDNHCILSINNVVEKEGDPVYHAYYILTIN